jgi:hypothetical protein
MIRVLLMLAIGALTAVAAAASPDRTWPAELRAAERWELAFDVGGVLLESLAAAGDHRLEPPSTRDLPERNRR